MPGTRCLARLALATGTLAGTLGGGALAADRALIISVAQYQDGSTLAGLDEDPRMMKEVAAKLGFRPGQVATLADRDATRAGIIRAIETQLMAGVQLSDRVLLYFSGHGAQTRDLNGDEADGCDEALVPYDQDNLLTDDTLSALLARIPARDVLFIVDSCFSGTISKGIGGQAKFQPNATLRCNQPINVTKDGTRGVGTFAVVDLRPVPPEGGASRDNQGRLVTFSAAAPDEVALTAPGGSLFTRAIHARLSGGTQPATFAQLREFAAEYIRTALDDLNAPGFMAHHPQLDGPAAALARDVYAFGRSDEVAAPAPAPVTAPGPTPVTPPVTAPVTAPPIGPEPLPTASGAALLDRYLNTSGFRVEVRSNATVFRLGEPIRYTVYSSDDGYLNLLELDAQGNIAVLFPNRYNQQNAVKGGQTYTFPGAQFGNYDFRAIEPLGKSRIVALVSTTPLNLYAVPGNQSGDFRTLLNVEHFAGLANLMKASGVMPLPTGNRHGAGSSSIEVRP